MRTCYADTSFFAALLNPADWHHQQAVQLNLVDRPILTSFWVLLELADGLRAQQYRGLFLDFLGEIQGDDRYDIVSAEQRLLDQAISLYRDRRDKDWSLTDCTSFVLMRERGLQEVLSADHHFEQAGFTILLK